MPGKPSTWALPPEPQVRGEVQGAAGDLGLGHRSFWLAAFSSFSTVSMHHSQSGNCYFSKRRKIGVGLPFKLQQLAQPEAEGHACGSRQAYLAWPM